MRFVEPYHQHRKAHDAGEHHVDPRKSQVRRSHKLPREVECQVPEEGVDEVRMHMSRRNSVLDGSDDDSSVGEHHKRDEYAFDGIFDETESLLGIHCSKVENRPLLRCAESYSPASWIVSVVTFRTKRAMFRK